MNVTKRETPVGPRSGREHLVSARRFKIQRDGVDTNDIHRCIIDEQSGRICYYFLHCKGVFR